MSEWRVAGKSVSQTELAAELTYWLNEKGVRDGVRVFREGATLASFQWAEARWLTGGELSKVWIVRLFCRKYELYARRIGYDAEQLWQLRLAAQQHHLPDGEPLTPCGGQDEFVLLLGESRDTSGAFDLKPNRYRRARIRYPRNDWQSGQSCGLVTSRYQPARGASIVCWKDLQPVALIRHSTTTNPTQTEAIT